MPPRRISRLTLDLAALSPFDQFAWLAWLRSALDTLEIDAGVGVGSAGLDLDLVSWCEDEARITVDNGPTPGSDEAFVFVSGAEVLSRKLLRNFDRIHIAPDRPPSEVDSELYWSQAMTPEFSERLARDARTLFGAQGVEAATALSQALRPSTRLVTLITSVFDGDTYLDGFLYNSARVEGYTECEHLLIRAGSPGQEHAALLRHVSAHPGAVYINLVQDPGLYAVWNLGARLSTARYLSNANLDDRRAPAHLRRLTAVLDSQPEIDAVSSTLRISMERNLTWEASADCKVMFQTDADRSYGVDELVQGTPGELRSRNLPHCMPVWRRELHAFHGYFDETRYGPSADWAFWLRVGARGGRFRLIAEPLGLYLKDTQSYWRRSDETTAMDARILREHADRRIGVHPTARHVNDALALLHAMAAFEGVAGLMKCIRDIKGGRSDSLKTLLSKAGSLHLGHADPAKAARGQGWYEHRLDQLFDRLVTLVHDPGFADGKSDSIDSVMLTWRCLCSDLHEITRDQRWLLLRAWVLRRFGDAGSEIGLLRHLHRKDPKDFWSTLQHAYRFRVDLKVLTALVTGIRVAQPGNLRSRQDLNIVYYPDYAGNTYQLLLYRPVVEAGGTVQGVKDLKTLTTVRPVEGRRNVLHIHWINAVFKRITPDEFDTRTQFFLSLVRALQARGFELYWTVHNNLSHEAIGREQEIAFRRQLHDQADRVCIHHPMVAELLDWLPGRDRLQLIEHGPYDLSSPEPVDRETARAHLGLDREDFVLAYIGQMRDYKALDTTLPWILDVLEAEPRMKLLISGRIKSTAVERLLRERAHERVILQEAHLDNEALEIHMRAADFGFLSYREIVTSGALFHWASCGVPVIAPSLGTIPAYLLAGWNGFVYHDGPHLKHILERCLHAPETTVAGMRRNARRMAGRLQWEFF